MLISLEEQVSSGELIKEYRLGILELYSGHVFSSVIAFPFECMS